MRTACGPESRGARVTIVTQGRRSQTPVCSARPGVVGGVRDCAVVRFTEQGTSDACGADRKCPGASTRRSPSCHFACRRIPRPQGDDRLQRGDQVGVAGEGDADVVLTARSHHHEVDGERAVDALLPSGLRRPAGRIAQVASNDGRKPGAALGLRPRLPPERGVGARVKPPAWSTAIGADACEAAARDSGHQQTTQSEQIHPAFAGRSVPTTERLTSAVIDVLIVEEDDHPPGRSGSHDGVREWSKESPAGAALPGRRGGLGRVYRSRVREQQRCGGMRVGDHRLAAGVAGDATSALHSSPSIVMFSCSKT